MFMRDMLMTSDIRKILIYHDNDIMIRGHNLALLTWYDLFNGKEI